MSVLVRSAVVVGALIAVACGRAPSDGRAWTVTPLDSPAVERSGQPQITVSGDRAILSWIERSGRTATLKFADRTGDGWSEPRTVASGDDWFVNWADVPSVIRLADRSLVAHWLQKSGPGTYAYDVRLAFSKDEGRTWSSSVTPHHDGTQTEHGFASLFQAPDNGLSLVWLDGRHMSGGHGDGHAGHGPGAMTLRAATFDPAG
ncbi:MAG: exo-alpha-sialidase, partial [Acidobacteria bacterium]|nr:exo-alpha-sialidase [Acidobacteriota bacterium]